MKSLWLEVWLGRVLLLTLLLLAMPPAAQAAPAASGMALLDASGNTVLGLSPATSAVNYLVVASASSANDPALKADGPADNLGLLLYSKGQSGVHFAPQLGNFLNAIGATSGHNPTLFAEGGDAHLFVTVQGKGNGGVNLDGGGTDANGADGTGKANYVRVVGASTGSSPSISAAGTDLNLALRLSGKNGGGVDLDTETGDYVTVTGGTPTIRARGGSTNVDLHLGTQGTGVLAIDYSTSGSPQNTSTPVEWVAVKTPNGSGYVAVFR